MRLSDLHSCTRFRVEQDIRDRGLFRRLIEALEPLITDADLDIRTACSLRFVPSSEEASRLRDARVLGIRLDVPVGNGPEALRLVAAVRDLHSLRIGLSWTLSGEGGSALVPALPALVQLPPPELSDADTPDEVVALVERWRAQHRADGLVLRRGPGYIELLDVRAGRERIIVLTGVQLAAYEACAMPIREDDVLVQLRGQEPSGRLSALLELLVDHEVLARVEPGWLLAMASRSAQGRQPQHDAAVRTALAAPRIPEILDVPAVPQV